jgi:hypothetical protein
VAIKKLKGVVGKHSKRYAVTRNGHIYGYARTMSEAKIYDYQAKYGFAASKAKHKKVKWL